jgi:drug/metabolite transporter (DMT)-like permease
MFWLIPALGANFIWAFINIGDKYVITNRIKNPYIYMIWLTMVGIITVLMIPFIQFEILSGSAHLLILLAAVFYFFGGFPYIKALQQEDVTRVNIWWVFVPIFTLIIAWVFAGDVLGQNQILAFFILITATLLASFHFKPKHLKFSKTFFLMLLACLSFAIFATILRYLTVRGVGFFNAFVWIHIYMSVLALILFVFKKVRIASKKEFQQIDKKLGAVIFSLGTGDIIGTFFNLWALSLAPAALVYSLEGFQAIFVFILVIIFSIFTKIKLKEELDQKNIFLKVVALVLGVFGILMLNLG